MERFSPDSTPQLPPSFFERDTVTVARDLLGAVLVSAVDGELTAGRIVETEAYLGADDPGSHAATRGVTPRNRVMYGPPGHAYVYFTYGNHHMLNVVTEKDGIAGAVLIRAVEPLVGEEAMMRRRGRATSLTDGPGKVAQAFGIDLQDNGSLLGEGRLAIHEGITPPRIDSSGRIGLSEGHDLVLRFYIKGNVHVSRARTGPRHKAGVAQGKDGR